MATLKNGKTKKTSLTIQQHLDILKKIENGKQMVDLADEYNVNKSTISRIKKRKQTIINHSNVINESEGTLTKKRYKAVEESKLEKCLFEWVKDQRKAGKPITGCILQEQAMKLNEKLQGNPNFKASTGWLQKFKARHGIRIVGSRGKKSSADKTAAEDFVTKLNNPIN